VLLQTTYFLLGADCVSVGEIAERNCFVISRSDAVVNGGQLLIASR